MATIFEIITFLSSMFLQIIFIHFVYLPMIAQSLSDCLAFNKKSLQEMKDISSCWSFKKRRLFSIRFSQHRLLKLLLLIILLCGWLKCVESFIHNFFCLKPSPRPLVYTQTICPRPISIQYLSIPMNSSGHSPQVVGGFDIYCDH